MIGLRPEIGDRIVDFLHLQAVKAHDRTVTRLLSQYRRIGKLRTSGLTHREPSAASPSLGSPSLPSAGYHGQPNFNEIAEEVQAHLERDQLAAILVFDIFVLGFELFPLLLLVGLERLNFATETRLL